MKLNAKALDIQLLSLHNEAVETKIVPLSVEALTLSVIAGRRLKVCESGCRTQVARQNRIYQILLYALGVLLAQ